jgi:hypothetical protein
LRATGVGRVTLLVHDDCRAVLARLLPYLVDPKHARDLLTLVSQLDSNKTKPTIESGPRFSLWRRDRRVDEG